jgi:hypothetical protein
MIWVCMIRSLELLTLGGSLHLFRWIRGKSGSFGVDLRVSFQDPDLVTVNSKVDIDILRGVFNLAEMQDKTQGGGTGLKRDFKKNTKIIAPCGIEGLPQVTVRARAKLFPQTWSPQPS